MNFRQFLALLSCTLCSHVCTAGTIVDSRTLNGSFEAGSIAPWSGGNVISDPAFASHGSNYAVSVATATRAVVFQFFPAAPTSSPTFRLTFDAQNGTPGFSTASAYLFARRSDSSFLYAQVTDSTEPLLTNSMWSAYMYEFNFEESWDTLQNMSVGIEFNDGTPGVTGLVDNVILWQYPIDARIRDVKMEGNTLTLSISNLAPNAIHTVERCFNLSTGDWSAAATLTAVESPTNWSEATSNDWRSVFYRVTSQ